MEELPYFKMNFVREEEELIRLVPPSKHIIQLIFLLLCLERMTASQDMVHRQELFQRDWNRLF